ncbi:unnamed protein product [Prunus armeniaca]
MAAHRTGAKRTSSTPPSNPGPSPTPFAACFVEKSPRTTSFHEILSASISLLWSPFPASKVWNLV